MYDIFILGDFTIVENLLGIKLKNKKNKLYFYEFISNIFTKIDLKNSLSFYHKNFLIIDNKVITLFNKDIFYNFTNKHLNNYYKLNNNFLKKKYILTDSNKFLNNSITTLLLYDNTVLSKKNFFFFNIKSKINIVNSKVNYLHSVGVKNILKTPSYSEILDIALHNNNLLSLKTFGTNKNHLYSILQNSIDYNFDLNLNF